MTDEPERSRQLRSDPALSVSLDPIASMLKSRVLDPPSHPGLLACLDRFEILGLIGYGGMGAVFKARDPNTSNIVAIKLLRQELTVNPQAVHRFLVEARHMKRMSHPNIIEVLGVSDRAEGPYFVMPCMEQGSLACAIRPGEPFDSEGALRISRDVACALSFAHSRGIIHRDIKPANVLLDSEGNASVTDFGLLRTVFNDTIVDVRRSHREGTPHYMSPAVAAGEAEDTRCDVYSFGAVLYELLTGVPPFEGQTTEDVLRAIEGGPPVPIQQRNPKAHSSLARIAEWAMARKLRDRYAQMSDVVADLDRVVAGEAPLGPHGREPRRRNGGLGRKVAVVLAAGVALAALSVATWVLWPEQKEHITKGVPASLTIDLGKGVKMSLLAVRTGRFLMGSPETELGREPDEGPQQMVTIRKPFYMGKYEVTQEQYEAVMGAAPWRDRPYARNGARNAASYITWPEATEFCTKLSERTGRIARLPTEAEWEYACRAGTQTRFHYGDDTDYSRLGEFAWYRKGIPGRNEAYTHPVGQKKPNAWGLHDMHGNVYEWCSDKYDSTRRVLRGGGWGGSRLGGRYCRSAERFRDTPDERGRGNDYGFRVVMDARPAAPVAKVNIETVTVGNAGNTADDTGYGAVGYKYRIGKFETTAGEYTEFLNAVAATDTYRLYDARMWSDRLGCKIKRTGAAGSCHYSVADDRAMRPVNYVNWGDAARSVNWLANGRPTGTQDLRTTEDGSYHLDGAIMDSQLCAVTRKADATWVIPTEDEWYKAAYHKNNGVTGNYFD